MFGARRSRIHLDAEVAVHTVRFPARGRGPEGFPFAIVSASVILFLLTAVSLAAEPEPEAALRKRLLAMVVDGAYRPALAEAERAIERDAKSVAAWQFKAYSLHRLGLARDAKAAYDKTVALDPGNAWAFTNLAELLLYQGDFDGAVSAVERAVELSPAGRSETAMFSRVHRERGSYGIAAAGVARALKAGADPAFCHAELGYLHWVKQDLERSRDHWEKARDAGADADSCAHGLALVDGDRPLPRASAQAAVERRRRGEGKEWSFPVAGIEVRTRVGPELPGRVERRLAKLVKEYSQLIGLEEFTEGRVRLHLSRTVEEHERHRRREFPAGHGEAAFTVSSRLGPWSRGTGPDLELYVAWSRPGLLTSLSHELVHALLRLRCPRVQELPGWLDEGLATWLELAPDDRGRLGSGNTRNDLLATLAEAEEAGGAWPLRVLLAGSRQGFVGRDARVRYAQSWALVSCLLSGPGAGVRLRRYLDALNNARRIDATALFMEVFTDDLVEFEARLARHVDRLSGK